MQDVCEAVRIEQLLRGIRATPVTNPDREAPARTNKTAPLNAQQNDHREQDHNRCDDELWLTGFVGSMQRRERG